MKIKNIKQEVFKQILEQEIVEFYNGKPLSSADYDTIGRNVRSEMQSFLKGFYHGNKTNGFNDSKF